MLNTFILMLALALNPAEATHKHHHNHKHRPVPSHVYKKHGHHPVKAHHSHAPRRVLALRWVPGHYDAHGHWIRARWVFGFKVTV